MCPIPLDLKFWVYCLLGLLLKKPDSSGRDEIWLCFLVRRIIAAFNQAIVNQDFQHSLFVHHRL